VRFPADVLDLLGQMRRTVDEWSPSPSGRRYDHPASNNNVRAKVLPVLIVKAVAQQKAQELLFGGLNGIHSMFADTLMAGSKHF
jgi:hypothetical protein